MHTIRVAFERLTEIPFTRLFDAIGVYVIWDARQIVRPSYIGQGNILKRFAGEHVERFHAPIDGYAAVLGDTSRQYFKQDAEIVETALLEVANHTDRSPTVNVVSGSAVAIGRIFARHGVLRVSVSGYDPFAPPRAARLLPQTRAIRLAAGAEGPELSHGWRKLRALS